MIKDDVETEEEYSYKSNREDKLFTAWDADYLRVDENTLFELVLVSGILFDNSNHQLIFYLNF